MADDLALFDVDQPALPPPAPAESEGVKRSRRQAAMLAAGLHPLSAVLSSPLRLHAEAGPADDRTADGRRCGNCQFRKLLGHHNRRYPKCIYGDGRISHGEATDVRKWWPGCMNHEWRTDG
ncbi:hypothetical protein GCM10009530_26680 [Microbispora corallina]|uniref:Uncharacterized protein n=1 Tax=Microbispora corallina TaxID=83302 RepID=A0ABQ4G526_9ACTN|nr:hypothetical protein [Microbispora corallina]GIH42149.1 hypothetical protein Mco01_51490 [Microbispora corallina]